MSNIKMMNDFDKQKIAIEHTLKGLASIDRSYYLVLRAFEVAKKYHSGLRKDLKTPEFQHQLDIIGAILNYRALLTDPVSTLIAALMHDVVEDYSKGSDVWADEKERERLFGLPYYDQSDLEKEFGAAALKTNNCLSKWVNGYKKTSEQYYGEISEDAIALIIKPEDRLNNLSTMFYVFTIGKQIEYATEVFEYFIPALKRGESLYPELSPVYQMLKDRLKEKAESVINAMLALLESGYKLTDVIQHKNIDIRDIEEVKSLVHRLKVAEENCNGKQVQQ